jgi:hypothetical protein
MYGTDGNKNFVALKKLNATAANERHVLPFSYTASLSLNVDLNTFNYLLRHF